MNEDELNVKIRQDLQPVTEYKTDIEKSLVEPVVETFECLDSEDKKLWIIGKKEGYFLTFDEVSAEYGLAFRNIVGSLVYLGDNGSIGKAFHTLVERDDDKGESSRKNFKNKPQTKTLDNKNFKKNTTEKESGFLPFRKRNSSRLDG